MIKYTIFPLALVGIATMCLVIDGRIDPFPKDKKPTNQPLPVCTTIHADGRIEGATPETELLPQLRGRVVAVKVTEGQQVEVGECLLQIDDREYSHAVASAEAQLSLAKSERARLVNGAHEYERREAQALHEAKLAELETAQSTAKRTEWLQSQNASSKQLADEHQGAVVAKTAAVAAAKSRVEFLNAPARADELAIADAKIAAAEARLELAKVQLDRTQLRAPFSGTVLQINVEPGELLGPETLEPAIVVADTSRLRVRAFVEEYDAPRVDIGMTATITADGLAGQTYSGQVVKLSPRMSNKQINSNAPTERYDTKMREIWIDVDEAHWLVIGLRVDVTIELNSRRPADEKIPSPQPSPTGRGCQRVLLPVGEGARRADEGSLPGTVSSGARPTEQ